MSARRLDTRDVEAFFENVLEAVRALKALNARRELIYSGKGAGGAELPAGLNPNPGDPTGRTATELADLAPLWDAEERALMDVIGEGRDMCHGIATALTLEHGLAMEYHYLWDLQWKQVASMLDRGITKTINVRREALEYVKAVGLTAAKEGGKPRVGSAEGS